MNMKKVIAFLLASLLLVGCLAGCSKEESKPGASGQTTSSSGKKPTAEQQTGITAEYAYEAEYYSFPEEAQYINTAELSGNTVYFVTNIKDGQKSETYFYTDEEGNQQTGENTYDVYRSVLMKMNIDTMEFSELDQFEMPAIPEGWEGDSNVESLRIAEDGTLWVLVSTYTYRYNLPENFDPATDEQWNYYENGDSQSYLLHLDQSGKEIGRLNPQQGEHNTIASFLLGADGVIYVSDYENVHVYDRDGNLSFSLSGLDYNELCQLSASEVGVMAYNYDELKKVGNYTFKPIDLEKKTWGTPKELGVETWRVYPGDNVYDFYYDSNSNIFGYRNSDKKSEKVVDWMDCDINSNNIGTHRVLTDGRVFALYTDYDSGDGRTQLIILNRVDKATIQEKTVLTLACSYLDWNMRSKIVNYNKNSKTHRIVVKDYSEGNTGTSNGVQKLNTEIIAGSIPDIFMTDSIPVNRYVGMGIIADLYPFIDADSRLSRDSFVPEVIRAIEQDGKLYSLPVTFTLSTAVGLDRVVGGYDKWNLAALKEAYSMLPDPDATVFGRYYTKSSVLSDCISRNVDYFIDWQNGKCNFDNEEFISLLEFTESFPLEVKNEDEPGEWESDVERVNKGKQLLANVNLGGLEDYFYNCCGLDGESCFVGYPSESGTSSNCFNVSGGMAISTTCSDPQAAWEFITQNIIDQEDPDSSNYYWGFPISKKAIDRKAQAMLEYRYATDENGEKMLDENGEPIRYSQGGYQVSEAYPADWAQYDENGDMIAQVSEWDSQYIEVYKMSKAQLQQVLDLIAGTTKVFSYDNSVSDIITEECNPFFHGEKDARSTAAMIQNRANLYVSEQS